MGRGKNKILGKSSEISRVRHSVRTLGKQNENVLIIGETGSGRTLIAQLLHDTGSRSNKEFIKIQCGALGDTIESDQVFSKDNNGYTALVLLAQNGTLYFENIELLNSELQNKLFNLLTIIKKNKLNIRILTSADTVIESKIRDGSFRGDLFQIVDELRINVPAIRERKQDIPFIFSHFLEEFCKEYEKTVPTVPYDVFEAILEYDWPGNIGELRNTVRNLVIMSPEGELSPEYLPFRVQPNPLEVLASRDLNTAVADVEKFLIRKALARYEGNQSKAAHLLQVSEATLRYKMKKHGFQNAK